MNRVNFSNRPLENEGKNDGIQKGINKRLKFLTGLSSRKSGSTESFTARTPSMIEMTNRKTERSSIPNPEETPTPFVNIKEKLLEKKRMKEPKRNLNFEKIPLKSEAGAIIHDSSHFEKSLELPEKMSVNRLSKPRNASMTNSTLQSEINAGVGWRKQSLIEPNRSFWVNKLAIPNGHKNKEGKSLTKAITTKELMKDFQPREMNPSGSKEPKRMEKDFENEIIKDQNESQDIWLAEQEELNELERNEVQHLESWLAIKKNEALASENYAESKKNQISSAYMERYLHPVDPELDTSKINAIMDPPPNGKTIRKKHQRGSSKKMMSLQVVEYIKDYKKYLKDLAGPAGRLVGKTSQPQKAPDAVRADLNRFILNDLVGRKLKTEIEQGEISNSEAIGALENIENQKRRNASALGRELLSVQPAKKTARVKESPRTQMSTTQVSGGFLKLPEANVPQLTQQSNHTPEEQKPNSKQANRSETLPRISKEPKIVSELAQRIAISKPAQRIAAETLAGFKCFQQFQAGQTKGGSDLSIEYLLWMIKSKNGVELEDDFKFSEQYRLYLSRKSTDTSGQLSLKGLETHLRMQLDQNLLESEKKKDDLALVEEEKYRRAQNLKKQKAIVSFLPFSMDHLWVFVV